MDVLEFQNNNPAYQDFLGRKLWTTIPVGFDIDQTALPDWLAPFQRDLVRFGLSRGRAAIFADTGLGKTRVQISWARQVHAHSGGNVLILAPLAVAQQTIREGAGVGVTVHLCRSQTDVKAGLNITNYEMLSHFDPAAFTGVVLDESSIIKHETSATRNAIIAAFGQTPYRLACTATPAPNDHTEIGNHAEFLGIMTRTEMLSTFFVHDGGKTSDWRLKKHAELEFWAWVSSWAAAIRKPSDFGYEDGAYLLPPLNIKRHKLDNEQEPEAGMLFAVAARGLNDQRAVKRNTLEERCQAVADLANAEPGEHWLVWCELNDEGDLLEKLIPGAVQVRGSDSPEKKAERMLAFAAGDIRVMISKSSICGFGMNFQVCARMAFVSVTHSYEQFYQAVRRCYRFGQARPVEVHVVFADGEQLIVENIQRKEKDAALMAQQMVASMIFDRSLKASGRDTEAYDPQVEMTLPKWLRSAV